MGPIGMIQTFHLLALVALLVSESDACRLRPPVTPPGDVVKGLPDGEVATTPIDSKEKGGAVPKEDKAGNDEALPRPMPAGDLPEEGEKGEKGDDGVTDKNMSQAAEGAGIGDNDENADSAAQDVVASDGKRDISEEEEVEEGKQEKADVKIRGDNDNQKDGKNGDKFAKRLHLRGKGGLRKFQLRPNARQGSLDGKLQADVIDSEKKSDGDDGEGRIVVDETAEDSKNDGGSKAAEDVKAAAVEPSSETTTTTGTPKKSDSIF